MATNALILVDLQNDYFPGGRMELEGAEAAAAQAARLLQHYRSRALPVFHIRHIAARPGATFFLPDTPGSEIHRAVAPAASESVIVKHFPNSFRETDLLERLQQAGVGELTICGAMSHMCIDATTRAAFDFGFTCRVAHDACATRSLAFESGEVPAAQVHAAFMAALAAAYARVTSTADVLK